MITRTAQDIYYTICSIQFLLVGIVYVTLVITLQSFWLIASPAYSNLFLVILITLAVEAYSRHSNVHVNNGKETSRTAALLATRQTLAIYAGISVYMSISRDYEISRLFVLLFTLIVFIVLYLSHKYVQGYAILLLKILGISTNQHVTLIGSREWCHDIEIRLKQYSHFLTVINVIDKQLIVEHTTSSMFHNINGNIVMFSAREFSENISREIISIADRKGLNCWIPVELSRQLNRRFDVENFDCLTLLTPPGLPLQKIHNRTVKRMMDICLSVAAIVLIVIPLMPIIWLIHLISSRGSLFYRQTRVGRNGDHFTIYKFRSMHEHNFNQEQQATDGDSRIIRHASWLRKYSIDELPQFINVLRGEMSIIGPRPHLPQHERKFEDFHELYGTRRFVRPGLSGLAQIHGFRGEIKYEQDIRGRADHDLFYVKHWSLWLDVKIVFLTIFAVLFPSKNAR
jgi:putative colanic acid biosynthesis UDP-glucose lipid carrier transferase